MSSIEYWDKVFSEKYKIKVPNPDNPVLKKAMEHFGDIKGKTIIDLGFGRGATSLFFAQQGANVISVDLSEVAVKNLTNYCKEKGITNIKPIKLSAMEIDKLGAMDFIFGQMILHHIEPFSEFVKILRKSIKQDGKGFFYENNARSRLLIWIRKNIVGKFGIPKYGDADEFPLTIDEIDELKKYFNVEIGFTELFLFRLIPMYFFKFHFMNFFKKMDKFFYKFPILQKYSYKQYLLLS